jgi:hypothetical protein
MRAGEPLPALVLYRWKGKNFLLSGWHRRAIAAEPVGLNLRRKFLVLLVGAQGLEPWTR